MLEDLKWLYEQRMKGAEGVISAGKGAVGLTKEIADMYINDPIRGAINYTTGMGIPYESAYMKKVGGAKDTNPVISNTSQPNTKQQTGLNYKEIGDYWVPKANQMSGQEGWVLNPDFKGQKGDYMFYNTTTKNYGTIYGTGDNLQFGYKLSQDKGAIPTDRTSRGITTAQPQQGNLFEPSNEEVQRQDAWGNATSRVTSSGRLMPNQQVTNKGYNARGEEVPINSDAIQATSQQWEEIGGGGGDPNLEAATNYTMQKLLAYAGDPTKEGEAARKALATMGANIYQDPRDRAINQMKAETDRMLAELKPEELQILREKIAAELGMNADRVNMQEVIARMQSNPATMNALANILISMKGDTSYGAIPGQQVQDLSKAFGINVGNIPDIGTDEAIIQNSNSKKKVYRNKNTGEIVEE